MTLRNKFVGVARSQVGSKEPTGDDKYIKWYNEKTGAGLPLNSPWCAIFVSWCAAQAGLPDTVLDPFASCTVGIDWLKKRGLYKTKAQMGRNAQPGDVIFYDWSGVGTNKHTGIVEKNENGTLTVIEGNKNNAGGSGIDAVARRTVAYSNRYIIGYGCLNFPTDYDVNGDGKVNAADAQEILQQSVGLKPKTAKADVNGDGRVTAADALEVLQRSVGLKGGK